MRITRLEAAVLVVAMVATTATIQAKGKKMSTPSREDQQIAAGAGRFSQLPGSPIIGVSVVSPTDLQAVVQVRDLSGAPLPGIWMVDAWLSDDDTQGALSDTPADGGMAVQSGTLLEEPSSGLHLRVLTNADGLAEIIITQSLQPQSWYVWAAFAGRTSTSLLATLEPE